MESLLSLYAQVLEDPYLTNTGLKDQIKQVYNEVSLLLKKENETLSFQPEFITKSLSSNRNSIQDISYNHGYFIDVNLNHNTENSLPFEQENHGKNFLKHIMDYFLKFCSSETSFEKQRKALLQLKDQFSSLQRFQALFHKGIRIELHNKGGLHRIFTSILDDLDQELLFQSFLRFFGSQSILNDWKKTHLPLHSDRRKVYEKRLLLMTGIAKQAAQITEKLKQDGKKMVSFMVTKLQTSQATFTFQMESFPLVPSFNLTGSLPMQNELNFTNSFNAQRKDNLLGRPILYENLKCPTSNQKEEIQIISCVKDDRLIVNLTAIPSITKSFTKDESKNFSKYLGGKFVCYVKHHTEYSLPMDRLCSLTDWNALFNNGKHHRKKLVKSFKLCKLNCEGLLHLFIRFLADLCIDEELKKSKIENQTRQELYSSFIKAMKCLGDHITEDYLSEKDSSHQIASFKIVGASLSRVSFQIELKKSSLVKHFDLGDLLKDANPKDAKPISQSRDWDFDVLLFNSKDDKNAPWFIRNDDLQFAALDGFSAPVDMSLNTCLKNGMRSSEKRDVRSLPEKLLDHDAERASKLQRRTKSSSSYSVREFMSQLLQAIKARNGIRTPQRLKSMRMVNYYLFGWGFFYELIEFRCLLIDRMTKAEIFSLFLEEGLKNDPLKTVFCKLQQKWIEECKPINEDSVIIITKLSQSQVIIETDVIFNKDQDVNQGEGIEEAIIVYPSAIFKDDEEFPEVVQTVRGKDITYQKIELLDVTYAREFHDQLRNGSENNVQVVPIDKCSVPSPSNRIADNRKRVRDDEDHSWITQEDSTQHQNIGVDEHAAVDSSMNENSVVVDEHSDAKHPNSLRVLNEISIPLTQLDEIPFCEPFWEPFWNDEADECNKTMLETDQRGQILRSWLKEPDSLRSIAREDKYDVIRVSPQNPVLRDLFNDLVSDRANFIFDRDKRKGYQFVCRDLVNNIPKKINNLFAEYLLQQQVKSDKFKNRTSWEVLNKYFTGFKSLDGIATKKLIIYFLEFLQTVKLEHFTEYKLNNDLPNICYELMFLNFKSAFPSVDSFTSMESHRGFAIVEFWPELEVNFYQHDIEEKDTQESGQSGVNSKDYIGVGPYFPRMQEIIQAILEETKRKKDTGIPAEKSWKKCPQGHLLTHESDLKKFSTVPTSSYHQNEFKCNICQDFPMKLTSEGMLRCNDCSYDICLNCSKSCPNRHIMAIEADLIKWTTNPTSNYSKNEYSCDGCRKKNLQMTSLGVLRCSRCSFDICPNCDVFSRSRGSSGNRIFIPSLLRIGELQVTV